MEPDEEQAGAPSSSADAEPSTPAAAVAAPPVEVAAAALLDNPDEPTGGGGDDRRAEGGQGRGEEEEEEDDDDDQSGASSAGGGDQDDEDGATSSAKRGGRGKRVHRSLPRIKTILQDEAYLSGILNILEQTGCANYPFASTSNGWMTAFHNVYASVALECHHPVGKNRHLKFKEKMVEIWLAMEKEVAANKAGTADNPLYALAAKQLAIYRNATLEEEETKQQAKRGVRGGSLPAPAATAPASTSDAHDTPHPKGALAGRRSGDAPPRKKQRVQSVLKSAAVAGTTPSSATAASPARRGPKSAALAVADLNLRLDRIEALVAEERRPSKLESPLRELHALVLQYRASPATFGDCLTTILPHYEDAVRALLTRVNEQAAVAMDPEALYQSLEAMGVLLKGHDSIALIDDDASEDLHGEMREAYQRALQAYLNLVNPHVAAAVERRAALKVGDEVNDASDNEDSEPVLASV